MQVMMAMEHLEIRQRLSRRHPQLVGVDVCEGYGHG